MHVLGLVLTRSAALLAVSVLCTLAIAPMLAPRAEADGLGPADWYSTGDSGCDGGKAARADPIGVLFHGERASAYNASRLILNMSYFWGGDVKKEQYLRVHLGSNKYECRNADESVASHADVPPSSRFHTRLWFVPASQGTSDLKTVATPHHEDLVVTCGHAVDEGGIEQGKDSGFDWARRELKNAFIFFDFEVQPEEWGNTYEKKQCDEDYAGGDGWGLNIRIDDAFHASSSSASNVKAASATLNGKLFTGEPTTEYWFAYGPNSSQGVSGYPNKTSVQSVSGTAQLDPSAAITGLTSNTQYYARLFARNQNGKISEGAEVRFIHSPAPVTGEDDNFPGPHVVGNVNGAVDSFFRTPSGTLGHAWTQGGSWSEQDISETSLSPTSVPHPVIQPNGTVDVFWRTPSGGLGHAWDDSNGWHAETLSGSLASDPHAVVQPNGTIDVLYRTPSGGLGHNWYQQGGAWQSNTLSGSVASDPYLVAHPNGTVDAFFRTPSGNLGHAWTQGGSWSYQEMGASIAATSAPHPVVQNSGTVDVFWRTPSGGLGHAWDDQNGWHTDVLAEGLLSEPHAVAQPGGTIDVFWRKGSGEIGHAWYQPGTQWYNNTLAGSGSIVDEPYAVTQVSGTVDVFWRTPSGGLGHAWDDQNGWHLETLSGSVASVPHAVAQPNGTIDVLYTTPDGRLGHDWYQAGGEWHYNVLEGSPALEPPIATTEAATAVKETTATLNANVNPEGVPTTYQFEYGMTTSYGTKKPVTAASAGSGITNGAVSQPLTGLAEGTTYHYRVVAESIAGTTKGADKTFVTPLSPDAPVAAYSLDTNEGEVAEDLTGEHDGAIEGASWTNGRYGPGLSFDNEDCVSVPDGPELQLTEEFTLEAWAKPEGSLNYNPILFKEAGSTSTYSLGIGFLGSGKAEGFIAEGEEGEGYENVDSPQAVQKGVWTHLALTYDGAYMRLYLNGELVATNATSTSNPPSSGPLSIGCDQAFGEHFEGKIDEVRIYNRALDGGEVGADKDAGIQTPKSAPVAAYSLDAAKGRVAEDVAGEHDGDIEGASWTNGKYGSALSFASEEDCVSVPDGPDLQLTEEFTLEAWAKPEGSLNYNPIVFKEAGGTSSYSLGIGFLGSGKAEGFIGEGEEGYENVDSPQAVQKGVWTHLALTYDGAYMRLYLNGELVATNATSTSNTPSTGPLSIGCDEAFGEHFEGKIDEVRIYNRALDGGEVGADKDAGIQTPQSTPVAAYSLDAAKGEVAEDLAGENDGAIESASWTTGRFGSALSFDNEDCVSVPDGPDLQLTEEFTLEAWAKPEGSLNYNPILFKEAGWTSTYSLGIGFLGSGKAEGFIAEGEEGEGYENVDSPQPVEKGVWTHLALTYDGAHMRLYLNGELVATNAATTSNPPSSGPLSIGCDQAFGEHFEGKIDEVRIYNRALDGGEVGADKDAGIE